MNVDVLKPFLDSLASYSNDLLQQLSAGKHLCHYTTLEGALAIIEGGDLWLSHLRFSNDEAELRYGQDLVHDELAQLSGQADLLPSRRAELQAIRDRFAATRDQSIYIACFCEQADLLSQWRAYADNGGGVSIEFDPVGMQLFSGPNVPTGLSRLWRVFYDPAQQRKIVRSCIDYPYWNAATEDERIEHVVEAIQFFVPTFKDPGFHGEMERRLIFTPGGPAAPLPRFRVRSGMVVPYVRLRELAPAAFAAPNARLPILKVMVGPGRHRQLNRDSLEMTLRQRGHADLEVEASRIPNRH